MKVWHAVVVVVVAALSACKSPPKGEGPLPAVATTNTSAPRPAALEFDAELLVREVELLRDREFARPPRIRGVTPYTPVARCTDACRNERVLLSDVLFAAELPEPGSLAHFDRGENAVLYDATATDAAAVEFAIVAALVEGLDRQTGAPLPQPRTWDELLAREAVARGPGVFVAALRAARAAAPDVDATALAAHPEALLDVAPRGVVANFARREGFALTAALYRSGGWSAVELLRNEPPASTAGVVRPDRYLDGADYGTWTFPAAVDAAREADGWTAAEVGRVGPAVFVEWLSRHVDPRVARAAYLGLESDAYRTWRRADGAWSWEWVMLWNTPATAQQVVEVLDAALRANDERRYSVVRRGATIAVVGGTGADDVLELATGLVAAQPRFRPRAASGLAFVPTPADELGSRGLDATLEANHWSDPATGLAADLSALTAWKVQKTDETGLRWFAKHADGSLLELTTEVASVLAPSFGTAEHETSLVEAFRKTLSVDGDIAVRRAEAPAPTTVVLDLTGTNDEGRERALRVWHFASGPYLVTVSLQAEPAAFGARLAEVEPAVQAIGVPAVESTEPSPGIIRFKVEE